MSSSPSKRKRAADSTNNDDGNSTRTRRPRASNASEAPGLRNLLRGGRSDSQRGRAPSQMVSRSSTGKLAQRLFGQRLKSTAPQSVHMSREANPAPAALLCASPQPMENPEEDYFNASETPTVPESKRSVREMIKRAYGHLADPSQELLERTSLAARLLNQVGEAIPGAGGIIKGICGSTAIILDTFREHLINRQTAQYTSERLMEQLSAVLEHIAVLPEASPELESAAQKLKDTLTLLNDKIIVWCQGHPIGQGTAPKSESEKVKEFAADIENAFKQFMISVQLETFVLQKQLINAHKQVLSEVQELALHKLEVVKGSGWYESKELCDGTRTTLIRLIEDWRTDPNHPIFWLCDLAGTGKSTLATFLAKKWKEAGYLSSYFFCARGQQNGTITNFWPTVATRLAAGYPLVAPFIADALRADLALSSAAASEQFDKLIYQPLMEAHKNLLLTADSPILFIIDALDEIDEQGRQSFFKTLSTLRTIPFIKVLLTSRPDASSSSDADLRYNMSVQVPNDFQQESFPKSNDIHRYLSHQLANLNQRFVELLAEQAGELFIWAEMACVLIKKSWQQERQLQSLATSKERLKLHELHLQILQEAPSDTGSQTVLLEILQVIVCTTTPLNCFQLGEILQAPSFDLYKLCQRVSSLFLDGSCLEQATPLRFTHLTIKEILCQKSLANHFWVNIEKGHFQLLKFNLKTLSQLQENILNLDNSGVVSNDDALVYKARSTLDWSIQIAATDWPHHAAMSIENPEVSHPLNNLNISIMLNWLEIVGLLNRTHMVIHHFHQLIEVLQKGNNLTLHFLRLVTDTFGFLQLNGRDIEMNPLEVYYSLLAFAPSDTLYSIRGSTHTAKELPTVACGLFPTWPPIKLVHSNDVKDVTWSSDGSMLGTIAGSSIHIWGGKSGGLLWTLRNQSDTINAMAFSADGQILASASRDKTVCLWSTSTGALLNILEGHTHSVNALDFSPCGQTLVSASSDNTLCLWNTHTGSVLHVLKSHSYCVNAVAFAPDGQILASASNDKTVRLWNVCTGSHLHTLQAHSDIVNTLAFTPDGQILASASCDKTVCIWIMPSGTLLHKCTGHSYSVNALAFAPNGQTLASASSDSTVCLWNTSTGTLLHTFQGHTDSINALDFSPDGQILASASSDSTVCLWNSFTGSLLQRLGDHSYSVNAVKFAPDGKTLASASTDKTVYLWSTSSGTPSPALQAKSSMIKAMIISPDGQTLASIDTDRNICLWSTATGAHLHTLHGHSSMLNAVVFSSDGLTLATSCGKIVELWSTSTGLHLHTLQKHSYSVNALSFSPSGSIVASASSDRTSCLWRSSSGALVQILKGHSYSVNSVDFSPNGQIVASGSNDRTVRLWSSFTGAHLHTLQQHSDIVSLVAFSPNGQALVSASNDGIVCVWSATTRILLHMFQDGPCHPEAIRFSTNSQLLTVDHKYFDITPWVSINYTHHSERAQRPLICFDKDAKTIYLAPRINHDPVLHFPTYYQEICCHATHANSNIAAFGFGSGKLLIMDFSSWIENQNK